MSFEQKPDMKAAFMKIALIEGVFTMIGIVFYLFTENLIYLLGAVFVGVALSMPLLLTAIRQSQEDTDAGR